MFRRIRPALWLLVSFTGQPVHARDIGEEEALRLALRHNAVLKSAKLEWRGRLQLVLGEQHRYGYFLRSQASAARTESLSALSDRSVATDESKALDLQLAIDRRLALGTLVSIGVTGNVTHYQIDPSLERSDMSPGPIYGLQTQLMLTQPLLRGAGTRVGQVELRRAHIAASGAKHAYDRATSETLSAVLTAYWELWYATRALEIQEQSHALLARQHEQALGMVSTGALAEADALPFATRMVVLEDAVLQARVELRRRGLELAALIGLDLHEPGELGAASEPTTPPPVPRALQEALRAALEQSYELKEISATLALAREDAKVAGEPLRPRLDLEAAVSLNGLGDRDLGRPVTQLGRMTAVSGHLSAIFELPFDSTQRRSQAQAAQLMAAAAQADLSARAEQISAAVRIALARIEVSTERLSVGEHAIEVARQLSVAQQGRFSTGLGTALQVLEAQEELRSAQLRLLRATTDRGTAQLALAHLTGQLLRSLAHYGVQ